MRVEGSPEDDRNNLMLTCIDSDSMRLSETQIPNP